MSARIDALDAVRGLPRERGAATVTIVTAPLLASIVQRVRVRERRAGSATPSAPVDGPVAVRRSVAERLATPVTVG